MTVPTKPVMPFQVVHPKRAEDLFVQPRNTEKWRGIVVELLMGRAVFVENMTRVELETLRSIINYNRYGRLRSRTTVVDGAEGKLVRLER